MSLRHKNGVTPQLPGIAILIQGRYIALTEPEFFRFGNFKKHSPYTPYSYTNRPAVHASPITPAITFRLLWISQLYF